MDQAALFDRIRIARPSDARAVAEIYRPYVLETPISFEVEAPDESRMARRMAQVQPLFPWLVYEQHGAVAGYAYGARHAERAAYDWSADVAVYLAATAHRQGVGRALYELLIACLRRQGYHRLYGGVALPNAASVGLHEACGFKLAGVFDEVGYKMGAWRAVGWYELALEAPPGQQPAPTTPFTPSIFEAARAAAVARLTPQPPGNTPDR